MSTTAEERAQYREAGQKVIDRIEEQNDIETMWAFWNKRITEDLEAAEQKIADLGAVITRQQFSFDAAVSWKEKAEGERDKVAVLLRRMHGQYHAILGLAPPAGVVPSSNKSWPEGECVNACKPAAAFLAKQGEQHDPD